MEFAQANWEGVRSPCGSVGNEVTGGILHHKMDKCNKNKLICLINLIYTQNNANIRQINNSLGK